MSIQRRLGGRREATAPPRSCLPLLYEKLVYPARLHSNAMVTE